MALPPVARGRHSRTAAAALRAAWRGLSRLAAFGRRQWRSWWVT